MSQTNSSSRLAPWQAMTMLAVGIAIIFFGLMALKVNARRECLKFCVCPKFIT